MNQVVVALYEHEYGNDIGVFATLKGAEAWREEIARQYWGDCGFDEEVEFNADLYWDEMNTLGREWFSYKFYEVEGT